MAIKGLLVKDRQPYLKYQIEPGDSISSIGARYGYSFPAIIQIYRDPINDEFRRRFPARIKTHPDGCKTLEIDLQIVKEPLFFIPQPRRASGKRHILGSKAVEFPELKIPLDQIPRVVDIWTGDIRAVKVTVKWTFGPKGELTVKKKGILSNLASFNLETYQAELKAEWKSVFSKISYELEGTHVSVTGGVIGKYISVDWKLDAARNTVEFIWTPQPAQFTSGDWEFKGKISFSLKIEVKGTSKIRFDVGPVFEKVLIYSIAAGIVARLALITLSKLLEIVLQGLATAGARIMMPIIILPPGLLEAPNGRGGGYGEIG